MKPKVAPLVPALCLILLASAAAPAWAQGNAVFFSKFFSPDTIGPGSVSTLTFEIGSEEGVPVTDLAFTDTLPAGVTIASPSFAGSSCGGTLTAPEGGSTITLSGGAIPALGLCQITVDVTAGAVMDEPVTYTNVSGDLTSSAGNSGPAVADLTVEIDRPGFSKSFDPAMVQLGETTTLTFTIDNTANPDDVLNLIFTDDLPVGLEIASPANVVNGCGGTLTAPAGGGTISLLLGSVVESCTITVDVTAGAVGRLDNRTGDLTGLVVTDGGIVNVNSGKASASLEVAADELLLLKRFVDDPAPPGGTVTLEFSITNLNRTETVTGITFTDDLDATLVGLTATGLPANGVCGVGSSISGTSLLTFTGGTLVSGETCTFQVTLAVPAGAATGAFPNTTSEVSGQAGGETVTGAAATDTLQVAPVPLLTKSFTDDPVAAGGTVTLEFTVTNTSPDEMATAVTFTDELTTFLPFPLDVSLPMEPCGAGSSLTLIGLGTDRQAIRLNNGSLAAGGSCTFAALVTIPAGFPGGDYVNTTSEIVATIGGETFSGPPATDTLTVIGAPTLRKEFTDDPVQAGGTVTLEFTLTHGELAPGEATDVAFTDDLGAVVTGLAAVGLPQNDVCGAGSSISGTGELTFTGGTLAPGETCTFAVTLSVPADAPPGLHSNVTSVVTATVAGVAATGNPAAADLVVAGLALTKEFVDDPVIPGGMVTLRFTIDNVTAGTTFTDVFFQDDLDGVVDGLSALGLPLVDPCGAGSSLVGSAGNTFLTLIGGMLAPGASCSFEVTLQVPAATVPTSYANATRNFQGVIEGSGGPAIPFGNASDVLVVESVLIELAKEFVDDPVAPGGTVTLRFTVTNLSAEPLADVAFTDDLDAALAGLASVSGVLPDVCGAGSQLSGTSLLTLTGGSLAGGASCTFDVTLEVPEMIAPGSDGVNVTSAASGTIGGLPVTGSPASDTLEVGSVTLTKTFDGPVAAGGSVTLTFTLENLSTVALSSLSFVDDLEAVLPGLVATGTPLADVCGPGSQLAGTSVLTFTGGSLAPGGSCTFGVVLQVPATTPAGSFVNTTSALSDAGLPVATAATAAVQVVAAEFAASKSFGGQPVLAGSLVDLELSIVNGGTTALSGITLTDDLSAVLPGLSAEGLPIADVCGAGSQVSGTSVVTLTGGTLGPGESCVVVVPVRVPVDTPAGTFVNVTSVVTAVRDGAPVSADPATAELIVASQILAIPTLSEWALALLALLLASVAVIFLRWGSV